MAFADARLCGISARLLSIGLVNLAALPVSFLVLLWLSYKMTLMILLMGSFAVVAYYHLSMKAVAYRSNLEKYAKLARTERINLVNRSLYGFDKISDQDAQLVAAFEQGAGYKFGESFAGQRNMLEASTFVSKVTIALVLMLVMLVAHIEVGSGTLNWGQLLVYIGVLQLFAVKLIGAARVLVSVNRFYPTISRYWRFIKALDNGPQTGYICPQLLINTDQLKTTVMLDRKTVYGLYLCLPVGKDDLSVILSSISCADAPADFAHTKLSFRIINPIAETTLARVADYFNLSSPTIVEIARNTLQIWGLDTMVINPLIREITDSDDAGRLCKLTALDLILLSMLSSQLNAVNINIIDATLLDHLTETELSMLQSIFHDSDTQVFISFSAVNEISRRFMNQAIALDAKGVVGIYPLVEIASMKPPSRNQGKNNALADTNELDDEFY